jgi:hypothetical protein
MSFDIIIRRGDTLPKIAKTFYVGGAPFNLTGFGTPKFIVNEIDGTEIFNHDANVVSAAEGKVDYQWTDADTDLVVDDYAFARFYVEKDANNQLTVPNHRPLSIMLTNTTRHEYSYSGNPSSRPIDRVRFLLQDTNMDKALFTDSEIEFLITEYTSPYAAAAEAAMLQSTKYTNIGDKTVGPLSVSYGDLGRRWAALSMSLLRRSRRSSGARAITTQKSTTPHVRLGMHDLANWSTEDQLLGEEL